MMLMFEARVRGAMMRLSTTAAEDVEIQTRRRGEQEEIGSHGEGAMYGNGYAVE